VVGLRNVGTKSELAAQVEAQVHVCIVMGGRATECRHGKRIESAGRGTSTCLNIVMGGLRNVGTKSELAAQVEAQVHACIVMGGRATECRHGKRIGSAGRSTSAYLFRCGWAG